jgi:IclR family transcriptional regulator, acetate operon repressor
MKEWLDHGAILLAVMTKPVRDARFINSLSRGVEILRLLAQSDVPMGVTDVADRLSVDPSTAYRLLATLERGGLVSQDHDSKKYSVGYGVLEIANALLRKLSVVDASDPFLRSIAAQTRESTHVAVLDGPSAVFVARQSGAGILRVETTVGASEPAYCTAVGKALLADHSERDLRLVYAEPLMRYTPHTITSVADLAVELERVRRNGYAFDDEELHPGVRCLAAPVRDHRGRIVAAFGVSMPATRLTRDLIPTLARDICGAADAISAQLGHVVTASPMRSSSTT